MNVQILKLAPVILSLLLLGGCASTPEGEPPTKAEVSAKLQQASNRKQVLLDEQVDVLAHEQYEDGADALRDAKKRKMSERNLWAIWGDANLALEHFATAERQADATGAGNSPVLQARASALNAGLRDLPAAVETLADVDDDLRDETDNFTKPLKLEELAKFQKQYLSLETLSVQHRELKNARMQIASARDDDADDLAPETLHQARVDLEVSENLIAQSPRNSENYQDSVDKVNDSALLLTEVMAVISNEKGTPESVAVKVVHQNRAIGKLSSNVNQLKSNLNETQSNLASTKDQLHSTKSTLEASQSQLAQTAAALDDTQSTLTQQSEKLRLASKQVRYQEAMEASRRSISPDVAEAYQQGNQLVFRIKKMGFATGKAEIPSASLELLDKIHTIVTQLNAEKVIVEGHTDSTGSAATNQRLSSERAIAVGRYLLSISSKQYDVQYKGYGETRPIASNETVEGRAQNRRVDLIVSAR